MMHAWANRNRLIPETMSSFFPAASASYIMHKLQHSLAVLAQHQQLGPHHPGLLIPFHLVEALFLECDVWILLTMLRLCYFFIYGSQLFVCMAKCRVIPLFLHKIPSL